MNIQKRNKRIETLKISIQSFVSKRSEKLELKYEKMTNLKKESYFCSSLTSVTSNFDILDESEHSDRILDLFEEDERLKDSFEDKYILKQKIGEGGNGYVYLCQHKTNQKTYAVKIFNFEDEHVLEFKKNFINIKQLRHPNIMKCKGLYINKNKRCAYLIMEYLRSKSLENFKIDDESQLRRIISQMLKAIKYIHRKNICHRDIKPENVLYDQKNKKIKLIDFGISKKVYQRGAKRDMLTIIGTQQYLAPEVYLGGGYDERIDLWALGVTLYQLVAGYTPFESQYRSETINNIIKGQFFFDQKIWNNRSSFLKDFITRLLKRKEERLTIIQAQKHIWIIMQSENQQTKKLLRHKSYNVEFNEAFHQIKVRVRNANSKEQGELSQFGTKRRNTEQVNPLFKSLNLIDLPQFELVESDDEDHVVTPKVSQVSKFSENQGSFWDSKSQSVNNLFMSV